MGGTYYENFAKSNSFSYYCCCCESLYSHRRNRTSEGFPLPGAVSNALTLFPMSQRG